MAALLWTTADGRTIKIEDMETTHLRNAIARIRRSVRTDERGNIKGWRLHCLRQLTDEIKRRGLKDDTSLNPARLTNRFRNLDLN